MNIIDRLARAREAFDAAQDYAISAEADVIKSLSVDHRQRIGDEYYAMMISGRPEIYALPDRHAIITIQDAIQRGFALAIDTETTGLDHDKHAPFAVGMTDGYKARDNHYQCNPDWIEHVDPSAEAVHGYSRDALAKLPSWDAKTVQKIIKRMDNAKVLIGHNIGFDITMINVLAKRFDLTHPQLHAEICDTQVIAKIAAPNLKKSSLDSCLDFFNIGGRFGKNHNALEDANLTFKLAEIIIKRI